VSRRYLYPNAGEATRKLVSTSREKLGGFGGAEISRSEQIDLLGNVTASTETLDGAVRVETMTRAGVSDAEISHYYAGRMMTLQQPGIAGLIVMGYDALGREVSRKEPRHAVAAITAYVPGKNQLATQTDAAGNTTRYTYYPQGSLGAGRVKTITLPDDTIAYRAYTACGDLRASWGSQTNPTWYEYDIFCQITTLHTWQNNPNLNVDSLPATPPAGSAKTMWNYDAASGLLVSKRDTDNKGASYLYDIAGRLKERLWARGVNTVYHYDGFGQLKTTDYSDTTPDVSISYDRLGRQDSQSNGIATSSFTYNTGNLQLDTETITYTLPGQAAFTRVIDRSQDGLNRESGYSLGSAPVPGASGGVAPPYEQEVSYAYSAASGRMETVGSPAGNFIYGYQANSDLIATVTGSAHTVTNTYESTRDVLDVKENKAGTSVVSRYDYGVNAIGQRSNVAALISST